MSNKKLKTSDLIVLLVKILKEHGDLPIRCNVVGVAGLAEDEYMEAEFVQVNDWPNREKHIYINVD